ncbi:ATP-binding protein [Fodinicola feengrottensis]|uniref:ATP-binding protein n=1 Tax=Fodinicola feengrottensis TaxID=435914 RepID=UPI0013D32D3F|nr:ATP-binding protein [Fodinicola feengrottensis]
MAHLADGGFGWLVLAEPASPAAVAEELIDLEVRLPKLRSHVNSEPDRIRLARSESRYRELARADSAGMWNVSILVGAADPERVRRAARLLCSASDLDEIPYVLRAGDRVGDLAETLELDEHAGDGFSSPFAAAGELIAAIARPPRRELPGIRVTEPPVFDVTPEDDGEIHLGSVLDDADRPVGDYRVRSDTLNRHTFVAGATGSGKSQTIRHLLEGLHHRGIPWLAIEPAKAEYAGMAGRLDGHVSVIRPGDPDALPVGLNPLEPERGFPLQTHIDLIRALFLAAFEAEEPFPQVLAYALSRCYGELGWNTVLSQSSLAGVTPRYPGLADLQTTALKVVEGIGYSQEISDNVRGFINVRMGSLRLGTPGMFFQARYPLDIAGLFRHNVVLEIEDLGNDQDKAFFIGVVLIRLYEHLRTQPTASGLAHVTVIEEAHRLLKKVEPGSPAAHAVELFAGLLAEIRAYGEGIIVAEQIPSKITSDVVKNTALKIMHRLPAADDRGTVGAAMNLDEDQSRHVVGLPAGQAVIFADGMDRPIRIQVPLGKDRENPGKVTAKVALATVADYIPPATLREWDEPRRLAADDPRIVLWAELHTIAHLVGREPPLPRPAWLDGVILRSGRPQVHLAVRLGLEHAVEQRYAGLIGYYQPEELIRHLVQSADCAIKGGTVPCRYDWPERGWQAGRYRWADVWDTLRSDAIDETQPHPETRAWACRGLDLTAATVPGQRSELREHPDLWRPAETIVTGDDDWRAAIDALSRATDPVDRLTAATNHLRTGDWLPVVLL